MSLFNKSSPEPQKEMPTLVRSRFQEMLDCANTIYQGFDRIATLCQSLILDCEKGMKFADRFRVDLTQSLVNESSANRMEEEMKAYTKGYERVADPPQN